jgi:hypothetical protein
MAAAITCFVTSRMRDIAHLVSDRDDRCAAALLD